MNWFRQFFCKHEIVSKADKVIVMTKCGGYIYQVPHVVTLLWCKKCGYSKKIVS